MERPSPQTRPLSYDWPEPHHTQRRTPLNQFSNATHFNQRPPLAHIPPPTNPPSWSLQNQNDPCINRPPNHMRTHPSLTARRPIAVSGGVNSKPDPQVTLVYNTNRNININPLVERLVCSVKSFQIKLLAETGYPALIMRAHI